MTRRPLAIIPLAALVASAGAAPTVPGPSGATLASAAVQCVVPAGAQQAAPMVQAGLLDPRRRSRGVVALDGARVETVTAADPVADVWLSEGPHTVVVSPGRQIQDRFDYTVIPGMCSVPVGNWFSPDHEIEYGASGKSYATVKPGCALNPATGQMQPFVNLFDNGSFVLNVSVNGVPLTQLSASRPHAPVYLGAGTQLISVAAGSTSTDHFVREGGEGTCVLP